VPELSYLSAFETLTSKYNGQGKELALYLMAVNSFLCGKKLVYKSSKLKLQFADDNHDEGLTALSSGERHLITMLYTASLQSQYNVILIDEPEMCLHIDWQERLLREIMAQKAGRQLIVCTHSPMIGAEYEDRMMEVSLTTTKHKNICEKKVPASC
jgi:predicted ATPase